MQAHSEKSGQNLTAFETYAEPKLVEVVAATPNKKEIGKAFKKDAKVRPGLFRVLESGLQSSGDKPLGLSVWCVFSEASGIRCFLCMGTEA